MKKILLLFLTLITISNPALSERYTLKMNSQIGANGGSDEGIDNCVLLFRLYTGSKTKFMWAEYFYDVRGEQKRIRFNNPYTIEPRDGSVDQIVYFKANDKYYVGTYSIVTGTHYSHNLVAFEFDDFQKAWEVLFLWSYLKLVESRDATDVHFIPFDDRDFYWDEESGFNLELPKDLIDDNRLLYNSNGYYEAFVDEQLLMNGSWHDLSNGKTYKIKKDVYSCYNGELYCNGERAYLSHDINRMYHVSVITNSEKFYRMLTSSKGYYYCQRCSNTAYGGDLHPIEMYGHHYQDITLQTFWVNKVASWRKIKYELVDDFEW